MANEENLKPFKSGKDERRNVTGANKGSRWGSTLLMKLASIELSKKEMEEFAELKESYPSLFSAIKKPTHKDLIEIRQILLCYSSDEKVSQTAIEKIKDRIDGKALQKSEVKNEITEIKVDWSS